MKKLFLIAVVALLSGCAVVQKGMDATHNTYNKPVVSEHKLQKEFDTLPPPAGEKYVAAVYKFQDLTGQRKSAANFASFSTAVTQGADSFLIKSLQDVGDQKWFIVVERGGLENLVKERTC